MKSISLFLRINSPVSPSSSSSSFLPARPLETSLGPANHLSRSLFLSLSLSLSCRLHPSILPAPVHLCTTHITHSSSTAIPPASTFPSHSIPSSHLPIVTPPQPVQARHHPQPFFVTNKQESPLRDLVRYHKSLRITAPHRTAPRCIAFLTPFALHCHFHSRPL
jgi:hypothetical protein